MAYDLHVVRTNDWLDADDRPITRDDMDALIAADPELAWSDDYVDMREDGVVTRFHLIAWNGEPLFWWYRNEIRFNSPDEGAQIKLLRMAAALGAFVVGDDGEHYRLVTDEAGVESVEVADAEG